MNGEANNPSAELVKDGHHGVGFERNRFGFNEINRPETVGHITDKCEPGRSVIVAAWLCGEMLSKNVLETVATQKSASSIGEESVFRLALPFAQPGPHDGGKLSTQRYAPFLPTFPLAADVSAGSDHNILALEPY